MKRLLKIVMVAGLAWSTYWFVAGYGIRRAVADWFAAQEGRGWQAEFAGMRTRGYPLRHVTTLTAPALADPATGAAWRADWLVLDSPAIWPGRLTLLFPPNPQLISYFDRTVAVTAQDMRAELHLHPGAALEVERLALTAGAWSVAGEGGPVAAGGSLTLAMDQGDAPETYHYDIRAEGFSPGDGLRKLASATDALPPAFETLSVDMEVTFDRAWDRRALEERRPQPVAVDLRLLEMQWGELRLMAAGHVTVDGQGIPTGEITLKAENWREMLAMANAAGRLPPSVVSSADRALTMLSRLGGNPRALDVQLNFRDGFVALGPIPLGPAPPLILR
ncbi:DUF2125 domain-containing protein [Jhaorihella thermophila]|uniref:DUF2125 domain-containing protein n=1 Tax=Jhaorihella thermophila TaxID=488547 RepID=A0A1H5T1R0_9RHOB|nr:DUF2125 domain-containing protein [Jhaorihella thermophila]SEF56822.1 hypothetical protein SAMN05421751_10231 [Jhaorihella thermophila]